MGMPSVKTCPICRREFTKTVGRSYEQWRTQEFCGRPCAMDARRDRRIMANGYIRVFRRGHPLAARDGYVLEHRLVLHEAGVSVLEGHHVHHINEDKTDNRLENLEVVTVREHVLHHARERGYVDNQFGRWPVRA